MEANKVAEMIEVQPSQNSWISNTMEEQGSFTGIGIWK